MPTYLQWKASIQGRLSINHDHFADETGRMNAVWEATKGEAMTWLQPRYLAHLNDKWDEDPYVNAEDMIDHLSDRFTTGLEKAVDRNRFKDCFWGERLHANETYHDFKSRFVHLAITGEVPRSEWFHTFWDKLKPGLRSVTLAQKPLWKENFTTMTNHLAEVEMERNRNQELTRVLGALPAHANRSSQPPKRTPGPVNRTPGYSSYSPAPPAYRGSGTPSPRINTPGPQRQPTPAAQEICYRCKKPGHRANACPEPPSHLHEIEEIEEVMEDALEVLPSNEAEGEPDQGNDEA